MPRGGKRPGSGRKKGGTNKITSDVKQAILEAFSALGGAKYLCAVAREDPKAFCALLGKLIPVKVAGDAEDPPVLRTIDAPPDETREQWLARTARERGLPAPAIVGAAVGSANGGDSK
jgi:hypothetical protein